MIDHEKLKLTTEILTTERLVLRPPHLNDADDIAKLANNIRVAGNLGTMPFPYFEADARDFLEKVEHSDSSNCSFAITLADSGEFMGICSLHDADSRFELPYIGYWLGEPYWSQGFATEAARALVDLYFKAGAFDEMMVSCHRGNDGSRRVIEKCGGIYWKPGEEYSAATDEVRPLDHFRITRESWVGAIAA